MKRQTILPIAILSLLPAPAFAHPHIFIDAKFEVVAAPDGSISELRNVWRFDEVFSSSVLLDFDKTGNLTLDASELKAVGKNGQKLPRTVQLLYECHQQRQSGCDGEDRRRYRRTIKTTP